MTTLITGATGGLGRELALLFANDDHDLLLTARHADQLAELQAELTKQFHVHVTSVVLDLSDTEAAEKLFRYAGRRHRDRYARQLRGLRGLGGLHA